MIITGMYNGEHSLVRLRVRTSCLGHQVESIPDASKVQMLTAIRSHRLWLIQLLGIRALWMHRLHWIQAWARQDVWDIQVLVLDEFRTWSGRVLENFASASVEGMGFHTQNGDSRSPSNWWQKGGRGRIFNHWKPGSSRKSLSKYATPMIPLMKSLRDWFDCKEDTLVWRSEGVREN